MATSSNILLFGSIFSPQQYNKPNETFKLFIPQVNKNIDASTVNTDLITWLQTKKFDVNSTNFFVKRLTKENLPLNSLLLTLKNKNVYEYILNNGCFITNLYYLPRIFQSKPYIKFCKKCLNYGHTTSHCLLDKICCSTCSKCHDTNLSCTIFCKHCHNNNHKTLDPNCPHFLNLLTNLEYNTQNKT
jgi:hypothetical protein